MDEQLLDTWSINNRINLYLLDAIAPEALPAVSASRGRSVGQQFAHLHAARLQWLEAAAPELMGGLARVENEQTGDKDLLRRALEDSGRAIEALLRKGLQAGRIRGFKPHPVAFLGYLIAHDGYHRGEIGLILTQSGHRLDQRVAYGMWEWGAR